VSVVTWIFVEAYPSEMIGRRTFFGVEVSTGGGLDSRKEDLNGSGLWFWQQ
jgi:hypothetical protein